MTQLEHNINAFLRDEVSSKEGTLEYYATRKLIADFYLKHNKYSIEEYSTRAFYQKVYDNGGESNFLARKGIVLDLPADNEPTNYRKDRSRQENLEMDYYRVVFEDAVKYIAENYFPKTKEL
jgi:hypothetical protein